ncbi:hypothetical protein [Pendulispora albinea]|uniref:Uncharacterized protein n=1 Tax=Pendulispora albinea TaxID=2741071 RepID=A0ABZ2LTK3_9BACT
MKRMLVVALTLIGAASTMGCGYSGVSLAGTDKVVVARNDYFLFGALRKAYVCKVTDAGLTSCADSESP